MSVKDTISNLKAKIDIIQKTGEDNRKNLEKQINEMDFSGLPNFNSKGKKLEGLKSKRKNTKSKKQNNNSIFEELISVFDKILQAGRKTEEVGINQSNQRLRQHVLDSIEVTRHSAKQIVMDCVKEVFFASDGICGGNSVLSGATMDSVNIGPKEIDFLNMLRVDPESDYGKIMYELPKIVNNKEKVNRGLYRSFTSTPYQYDTPSNKTLFRATWEPQNQWFAVTGLTQGPSLGQYGTVNVGDFFDDYYSNMEMPDLGHIIKNAMLLTLKACDIRADKNGISVGGNVSGMDSSLSWDPSLDKSINDLERMINKIFAFCNNNGNPGLKVQNATKLFNENEENQDFYFDFDDVEGIDLEDEDARRRKVLRFKDCNNYEVPYNTNHMEDFVYLENKVNNRDWIDGTLSKAASDAYEQSDFSIDLPSFKISLNLSFIINLPKALVMSIITPKMFIPIVAIYKLFVAEAKNTIVDVKVIMKKLKKLFLCIIDKLFWKFIREFWKRLKADLKNFLEKVVKKILREKFKRYYVIIAALVALLKKIIEDGIDNCQDLFEAISLAIDAALDASGGLSIPFPLLSLAGALPGFSSIKTHMDTVERMSKMGIPTGDVNGEANYHLLSHAAATESMGMALSKAPIMIATTFSGLPSYGLLKP
ncbi:MAG: hypothetical protein RLZ10_2950 [Bacteroidota bacterium]|jgi:hypothetical protein